MGFSHHPDGGISPDFGTHQEYVSSTTGVDLHPTGTGSSCLRGQDLLSPGKIGVKMEWIFGISDKQPTCWP